MTTTALGKEEILEAIGKMSVLELADLIEAFKAKFNVSSSRPQERPGRVGRAARPRRSRRRLSSPSSSRKPVPRRSRSSRWCGN
jgi:hypothetical protein